MVISILGGLSLLFLAWRASVYERRYLALVFLFMAAFVLAEPFLPRIGA